MGYREYKDILVDNPTCSRRFHLFYEEGATPVPESVVKCVHCGSTVYAVKNHPEIQFAREENLIKSPDGIEIMMEDLCRF